MPSCLGALGPGGCLPGGFGWLAPDASETREVRASPLPSTDCSHLQNRDSEGLEGCCEEEGETLLWSWGLPRGWPRGVRNPFFLVLLFLEAGFSYLYLWCWSRAEV